MEAVAQLISQGKVRHAGVCNYNEIQLAEALKYVPLVSDQVPYSMVKRQIETAVVPFCLQHGLAILAYSPLERGLLTGKMQPGHQFAAGDHRAGIHFFSPENLARTNAFLDKLRPLAEEKNASLSQLVLRWTVEQPGITIALAGARNKEQAVQNAAAVNVKLNADEISFISDELAKLELVKKS
jgi:aryl-alcohol dehydrogenase-like predicted oxidoreductase